jgi:hypothetical protein
VVTPGGGATLLGPITTYGFSARWHSVCGGGLSEYTVGGIDPIGFAGIHARTAMGGYDGHFSLETDVIVAIPPTLARDIIMNRGWVFSLPPVYYAKLNSQRQSSPT